MCFIQMWIRRETFQIKVMYSFSSVEFSSVAHSCLTLGDPMNGSTPSLPLHDQLTEFTQTRVDCVGDAT